MKVIWLEFQARLGLPEDERGLDLSVRFGQYYVYFILIQSVLPDSMVWKLISRRYFAVRQAGLHYFSI